MSILSLIQSFVLHPACQLPKRLTEISWLVFKTVQCILSSITLSFLSFFLPHHTKHKHKHTLGLFVPPVLKQTIELFGEYIKRKRSTVLIVFHNFLAPLPDVSIKIFLSLF